MAAHQLTFPEPTDVRSLVKLSNRTRAFVYGASGAGKSSYIYALLSDLDKYFDPVPQRVIYFHKTLADNDLLLSEKIQLRSDDPLNLVNEMEAGANLSGSLIILDDALNYLSGKSSAIVALFTRLSNHSSTSVFFVSQQMFSGHHSLRTVFLNCNHFILFPARNDPSSLTILSSRLYPNKPRFFPDALRQISTRSPYSPLHINTKPDFILDQLRVFSGFLKGFFCTNF